MLDRLFDFLLQVLDLFRFWIVVDVYEGAVVLRFGKLHRVLTEPGIYAKLPFWIDRELTDTVVPTAKDMPFQVVTLADGTAVAVSPVITYRTRDIEKLLLGAEDAEAAVRDSARGTIREELQKLTWEEARTPEAVEQLTKAVRREAFKWGVEVMRVSLSDLQKVRTLRIVTGE